MFWGKGANHRVYNATSLLQDWNDIGNEANYPHLQTYLLTELGLVNGKTILL